MFNYLLYGSAPAHPTEARTTATGTRHYIVMGYAGFNSPANNRNGYESETSAQRAILRYQAKGERARDA
jgi:hypothetical protein